MREREREKQIMQIEFVVDAKKANEMVGFIFIMMRCVSMEMRDGEHMPNFFPAIFFSLQK
jgi:hypothetical protein